MESVKKTQKKRPLIVKKPFAKGKITDRQTVAGALKFLGGLVASGIAYLLIGTLLIFDQRFFTILSNSALLLAAGMLFYQMGMSSGASAVEKGENTLQRLESGREVSLAESALCYHPLKGFVTAVLGSLPVLVCCGVLGLVATRQMTSVGTLPGWVAGLSDHPEVMQALVHFQTPATLGIEDTLRILVRLLTMPVINIIGAQQADALLTFERFSALFMLLPACCYGLGYTRGTAVRTKVHSEIAKGKRRQKRKAQKQRQARIQQGPQQLN